jgi:large subunit ribosomal protein L29
MKATNLREQTDEELQHELHEAETQLAETRVKQGFGEGSAHPIRMRGLRRDIARIKTVLRERESKDHG